jgi:hypothetical protein
LAMVSAETGAIAAGAAAALGASPGLAVTPAVTCGTTAWRCSVSGTFAAGAAAGAGAGAAGGGGAGLAAGGGAGAGGAGLYWINHCHHCTHGDSKFDRVLMATINKTTATKAKTNSVI